MKQVHYRMARHGARKPPRCIVCRKPIHPDRPEQHATCGALKYVKSLRPPGAKEGGAA